MWKLCRCFYRWLAGGTFPPSSFKRICSTFSISRFDVTHVNWVMEFTYRINLFAQIAVYIVSVTIDRYRRLYFLFVAFWKSKICQRNVVSNTEVMCDIFSTTIVMLVFEMVLDCGAEISVPNAVTK